MVQIGTDCYFQPLNATAVQEGRELSAEVIWNWCMKTDSTHGQQVVQSIQ